MSILNRDVQEAYADGVSTRKIDWLAGAPGIKKISASQVSDITIELDGQVEAFRKRRLDAAYPILGVDSIYEKIRTDGYVVSIAVMVVTGVKAVGNRAILAVKPMWDESEGTHRNLIRSLNRRGLGTGRLVVSADHKGLQAVI